MSTALIHPIARGQKRSKAGPTQLKAVEAGRILQKLKEEYIEAPLNKKCGVLTSKLLKFLRRDTANLWKYTSEEVYRINCVYEDWSIKGIYKGEDLTVKNITRLTMRCTIQFYITLKNERKIKACRKRARLDPKGHLHFEPALKLQKDIALYLREDYNSTIEH